MRHAMHAGLLALAYLTAFALAPAATAQAPSPIMGIDPPNLTFKEKKKIGEFLGGVFVAQGNNSQNERFKIIADNLREGALFRTIATNLDTGEEVVLAEELVGKKGKVKTKSNGTQPLPDGFYDVELVMLEPGEDDFRAFMFGMIVDTTPPGPAPAPDLPSQFDTGLQSVDNLTRLREFSLTGTAEPNTLVQVAIDGKTKNSKKTPVSIVDQFGNYTVDVLKAPRGEHDYAVVQTDIAGNESVVGVPIRINVDDKSPKKPKNLRIVEADVREERKGLTVANTRVPRIVGEAEPGQRFTLSVDGVTLVNSIVGPDGSFFAQIPRIFNGVGQPSGLTDGLHEVTATQFDVAGNLSKPSKSLRIFVEPGTKGGEPPMDIVLSDQFNGTRNPAFDWVSAARDSNLLSVTENPVTDRLEFRFTEIEGDRATAAFVSDRWSFDLTKGFKFRVDWEFRSVLQVFGRQGLVVGVVSDASNTSGEAFEGAVARIGRNDAGDIVRFERLEDGVADPDDTRVTSRLVNIGAVFFDYNATTDTLRMTIDSRGFNDPNAFVINNFRSKLGADRGALLLGAEVDGFTPSVAASNAFLDNLVIEEGLLAQDFVPISSGANLIPPRSDDFNDGVLSPDWTLFTTNSSIINPTETGGRLQLPIAQNNQTGAGADERGGVIGSDWALDLTQDFRIRVDWRFNAPETMFGEVDLAVGLAQEFDPETSLITEGALFVFRRNANGRSEGPIVRRNGVNSLTNTSVRSEQRGTLYIEFDASANRLSFSQQGFSDDTTTDVTNFRTGGLTAAQLALFAASGASSPAAPGPVSFFDNVFVDLGTIVPPPPPPMEEEQAFRSGGAGGPSAPARANSDGSLDANPCPFDVDGDGDVDGADLAALLARRDPPATAREVRAMLEAMGPCPG